MSSPFLNSLSISGYDKIVLRESSHHCEDKNRKYDVLDFMKAGVVVFSINLHYNIHCKSRLLVAPHIPPQPHRSACGPYLLPLPYGEVSEDCDTCYVDWYFEHPDGAICVDKVFNVYGDQIPDNTLTEEMHDSLVEQIIKYLDKQPAPYTGD